MFGDVLTMRAIVARARGFLHSASEAINTYLVKLRLIRPHLNKSTYNDLSLFVDSIVNLHIN